MIKKIFFSVLRVIVLNFLEFERLYINRFVKQYYTEFVYKKSFSIGEGVRINGKIKIHNFRGLVIGNNVHIGNNCFFNCEGGLIIGDNTHISRNVSIYSSSHNYEGRVLPYDQTLKTKPVTIGRNSWIGMNVSIAPGVQIGEGAIIGLGAVVNKDVNDGEIIVQTGFKNVSSRNMEHYKHLENNNLYGGASGIPISKEGVESFLSPINRCKEQVFILSTGRSGSQTIASVLNQHPEIQGSHEPHWQFFKLSTEYEYGIISREFLLEKLHEIYTEAGVVNRNFVYAESDQKLSNMVDLLIEIFPDAKFVWCIRSPEKFVKSAYTRGWYTEKNEFDKNGRLLLNPDYSSRACRVEGPRVGSVNEEKWESMDSFEKCCWYWSYWNLRIERQLSSLPQNKWLMINIDHLDNELDNLKDFLRIDDFDFVTVHKNKAHKTYKKTYNSFQFSKNQLEQLEEWCGALKNKWF